MFTRIVKTPSFLILIAFVLFIPLNLNAEVIGTRTEYNNNSVELLKRSSIEVDPTTNALNISIPLQEYPGRGGSFPVVLRYNSKVWRTSPQGCWTPPSYPDVPRMRMNGPFYSEYSNSGWTSTMDVPFIEQAGGLFTVWIDDNGRIIQNGQSGMPVDCGDEPTDNGCHSNDPDCVNTPVTSYSIPRILVRMPEGVTHELRQNDTAYIGGGGNTGIYNAVDGSNLKYDATTQMLWMPDGTRYLMNSSTETQRIDRNGNKMVYNHTSNQWTDTVGRSFSPFGSTTTSLNLPKVGGTSQYQFQWKLLSEVLTNPSDQLAYAGSNYYNGAVMQNLDPFLFGGDSPMLSAPVLFNPKVLAQIDLPNGQSYKFTYNKYAEIDKVVLPTGGYKKYRYAMVPTQQFGGSGNSFEVTNRGVVEMWESPSGNPAEENLHHWTFESNDGDSFYTTKTTAPNGAYTIRKVHSYDSASVYDSPHWGFNDILDGKTLEEKSYDSTNTLRSRTIYNWTYDGPVFDPAGNCNAVGCFVPNPVNIISGPPPARNARLTSKIDIIVENGNALAKTTSYEYDPDLNNTAVNEYDYVPITVTTAQASNPTISQGNLLRRQETTFLVNDPNYSPQERNAYRARNLISLQSSTRIKDGNLTIVAQTATKYDETSLTSYPSILNWTDPGNGIPRGNPTTFEKWLDTTNSWIVTRAAYDQAGNTTSTTDPLLNQTNFNFTDSFSDNLARNTYAFATLVTTPVPDSTGVQGSSAGFATTAIYDFSTGLTLSTTDPNGHTTTLEYNDPFSRPTKIIQPNGHQTISEYGAGTNAATRWLKVKTQIDESKWKEKLDWYDGFGRTVKMQSIDSGGDIFVDTEYDNMNRQKRVTNHYRLGESINWTENFYDDLSRVIKIKTPDNAESKTFYSLAVAGSQIGAVVTVEDQSNKARRIITNALGWQTRVDEPNNAGQLGSIDVPNQPTVYNYNVLNNLTQVQQIGDSTEECGGASGCTQTRTFVYDSLSRLKSSTSPESGLTQYEYDLNGNVTTRTDARGIVTTYGYDGMNRIKNQTYTNEPVGSETPDVTYYYDNLTNAKGKLLKISSSVSVTEYSEFNVMGQVTRSKQITDGVVYGDDTHPMTYTYNLAGKLVEQKYPSGRVVKNTFDNDGDLSIVQSSKNQNAGLIPYAKYFTYTAAGKVSSMQLGNGSWESTVFNNRLQPTQIALGTVQNGTNKLKLDFTYETQGQHDNNGNILSQTITTPSETRLGVNYSAFSAVQTYNYDSLNRIKQVKENINANQTAEWKQTFKYDRYGNREFDTTNNNTTTLPINCDPAVCNPTIDRGKNQLIGHVYDNAGNAEKDPLNRKFTYDGENKQTKLETTDGIGNVTGTLGYYFYDGKGKRIKKVSFEKEKWITTVFVYDASGKTVAEYSTNISPTPQIGYLTNDHLGSPRANTNATGNVTARHDYMPFGEEVQRPSHGTDQVRKKFTGYERDNESNLYYAKARMFAHGLGRFTSADPYSIVLATSLQKNKQEASKKINNYIAKTQQWNQYNYTVNNPLTFTDSTGMYQCFDDKNRVRKCDSPNDKAFEEARQRNLLSKDEKVRKAAESYGNPDEANDVYIKFGKTKGDGTTSLLYNTSDGRYTGGILVTFSSQAFAEARVAQTAVMGNGRIDTVVAHEGTHVADYQVLIANRYISKETHRDLERRAYQVANIVLMSYGFTHRRWNSIEDIDAYLNENKDIYPNLDQGLVNPFGVPEYPCSGFPCL